MRNLILAVLLLAAPLALADDRTPSAPGAEVYIISPQNGAKLRGPVRVQFGLKGMGVAPAGVKKEGTGHHHLLVDVTEMPAAGKPIAKDEQHIHFGNGQTETMLHLAPGKHTLQLELADENHIPFDPPIVSQPISITVR